MKHTDFLRSLKTLKSRLLDTQKKPSYFNTTLHNNKEKVSCTCKDASGEAKYLYTSKEELAYLLSSKSISLYSYRCPYEKGWHLTKG